MMKKYFLIFFLLIAVMPPLSAVAQEGESAPFAVVELFTSEGCSSCPSADSILIDLTEDALRNNKRIFTLGFHVDYWNYLGWEDRFSKSQFSARQRSYARTLKTTSVYTPQMIINGAKVFVGSRRGLSSKYIKNALSKKAQSSVQLKVVGQEDEKVNVSYTLSNLPAECVLNIALVESQLSSEVISGENSGRVLEHANVVRSFQSIDTDETQGEATFQLPSGGVLGNSSIVGYLQNTITMEIVAAQSISLSDN